jgi:hypothetical protein
MAVYGGLRRLKAKNSIASQAFPCGEKHNQHKVQQFFYNAAIFISPTVYSD